LNNLPNSPDVAILFLDRSLCICWFTPSMKALLELMPADIGRQSNRRLRGASARG
jgi:hypothetical protein